MNSQHRLELRRGNRAFDHLIAHYQPLDEKLQTFVESLPKIAHDLYNEAEDGARGLLRTFTPNPLVRTGRAFAALVCRSRPPKEIALANCIFDLHLTVVFEELQKYAGDAEVASLLVDALLYQATGCEASSPTSEEVLDLGTQNARGIQKFKSAHELMPHIGDIETWMFGKEFSAIVFGDNGSFSSIISIRPFSLVARTRAQWQIRYVLYGTRPTRQDEEAMEATIKEQDKKLQEMIDSYAQGDRPK